MAAGDDDLGVAGWGTRVVVLVAVAVVVAVVFGAVPGLLAGGERAPDLNNSEYAVSEVSVTQIPAEGSIDVEAGDGTIVIDRSHANRFTATEIDPLYEALSRAGYDVEFHDRGPLAPALEDATAFLIIDPGVAYSEGDAETLRSYTDSGGRLVVLGEPNRIRVSGGLGGVSTSEQQSRLANLAAAFEVAVSKGYVYHQSAHDGNYKSPLASPVGDASDSGSDVALYTPAAVTPTGDGEVVLRARGGARLSDSDEVRRYPVGVRTGNALVLGDSSFIDVGRYNVADNEEFLGYVVGFMSDGDPPGAGFADGVGDEEPAGDGGNSTTTPSGGS